MCMSCRCPKPGCGHCVALEEGFNSSRAAVLRAGRALDVHCSCGEAFCLCCGGATHEPAPCAAVSWPIGSRDSIASRAVATDMGLHYRKLVLSPRY